MKQLIAISGKAQHGKDTTGAYIAQKLTEDGHRVIVAHYADLVKYVCKTFFGWDGQKDEAGRHLLQYVGTDVVRRQDPNYWVDFIIRIVSFFGENWDYIIIPDTRFPNEIERLRESGLPVTHIRVVRPDFVSPLTEEQQKHPSETSLDNYPADAYIINHGTRDELYHHITTWIKESVYGNEATRLL